MRSEKQINNQIKKLQSSLDKTNVFLSTQLAKGTKNVDAAMKRKKTHEAQIEALKWVVEKSSKKLVKKAG